MKDLNNELNLLQNEDFIWLIYFFIVIFALIANKLERSYIYNNNIKDQQLAQKITTTILIVAFFIYLYFVLVNYKNLEFIKKNSNNKDVRVAFERLITAIIFLVGGAFAIYADFDANSSNVDLAIF